MKIIHDAKNIKEENSDGIIYVMISDNPFPLEGWLDFMVAVIAWWVENLNAFLAKPQEAPPMQNRYQLSFLDGPWTILLDPVPDQPDLLRLQASEKVPGSHMDKNVQYIEKAYEITTIKSLVDEIFNAATEILEICFKKEIDKKNPDVTLLSEELDQLNDYRILTMGKYSNEL